LQEVSKVFVISHNGEAYLKSKYPKHAHKIHLSYLGVLDHGINPLQTVADKFTLVSCSNLLPVKRVALIAEALKHVKLPIKWIHFGDGPLMETIKASCKLLPSNVEVDLKGRISNADLMGFYKQTHVSLFINISKSEGLPVSIMEAVSFGIPILATNVGGTSEIVTDKTGILIDEDVTPLLIAKEISAFKNSYFSTSDFRQNIKAFWKQHYDASVNYLEFIGKLNGNKK